MLVVTEAVKRIHNPFLVGSGHLGKELSALGRQPDAYDASVLLICLSLYQAFRCELVRYRRDVTARHHESL